MDLPDHVAVIPDGNRRWATLHGVPPLQGHRRGAQRMHEIIEVLIQKAIPYLTVWGFSGDNWKRTAEEVQSIFQLLQLWIEKDTPWLHENGVRLKHIGRFHELPQDLQEVISQAITLTHNNVDMTLNLAFNYTGRTEIMDAVRRFAGDLLISIAFNYGKQWDAAEPSKGAHSYNRAKLASFASFVAANPKQTAEDEEFFSHYLYADGMPDVDLVIRTAGEFRLSNFLLWQTAYSEFYFTDVLWPDFDEKEFERALHAYSERKRRFGGD